MLYIIAHSDLDDTASTIHLLSMKSTIKASIWLPNCAQYRINHNPVAVLYRDTEWCTAFLGRNKSP